MYWKKINWQAYRIGTGTRLVHRRMDSINISPPGTGRSAFTLKKFNNTFQNDLLITLNNFLVSESYMSLLPAYVHFRFGGHICFVFTCLWIMKVKQQLTLILFYLTTKITKQIVWKISFGQLTDKIVKRFHLDSRSSLTSPTNTIINMHVVVKDFLLIFWLFWICLNPGTLFRTEFSCSGTGSWKIRVLTAL